MTRQDSSTSLSSTSDGHLLRYIYIYICHARLSTSTSRERRRQRSLSPVTANETNLQQKHEKNDSKQPRKRGHNLCAQSEKVLVVFLLLPGRDGLSSCPLPHHGCFEPCEEAYHHSIRRDRISAVTHLQGDQILSLLPTIFLLSWLCSIFLPPYLLSFDVLGCGDQGPTQDCQRRRVLCAPAC